MTKLQNKNLTTKTRIKLVDNEERLKKVEEIGTKGHFKNKNH